MSNVHVESPDFQLDAAEASHAAHQCDEHPEVAYHRRTGRLICRTCDTRGTVVNSLTSESVICHRCGGAGDHEPEPDDPEIDANAEYYTTLDAIEAAEADARDEQAWRKYYAGWFDGFSESTIGLMLEAVADNRRTFRSAVERHVYTQEGLTALARMSEDETARVLTSSIGKVAVSC